VFWLKHHDRIARDWERFAEIYSAEHGTDLAPGEKRMLVVNVRVEDTHEQAWAEARPGHDEFWRFLGPYGWSRGYLDADGSPTAPGLIPTLEQSVDQKVWIIGSPEEVAEGIATYRDRLQLSDLCIFPNFPGDTYDTTEVQMQRFAEEVLPLL
jgi:alkanesulfonate monooxygenase SsuD/methylene tetrahydromethanopterin reductase-like flavin-dependent oxidoreductase (luciferase family)